jgi:hypothetical protein
MKKFLSVLMAISLVSSMGIAGFAANGTATMPETKTADAAALTDGKSVNDIPVKLSSDATVLDVDVPTSFPTVTDPDGETKTPEDGVPVVNNSYGSIIISNITVKNNAKEVTDDTTATVKTWNLAAYDKTAGATALAKFKVDSNQIAMKIWPKSDSTNAKDGTPLYTDGSSTTQQTLLNSSTTSKGEWVLQGKTAADNLNKLHIKYDNQVSASSTSFTNMTVAHIIVTVAWNTETDQVVSTQQAA